MSKIWTMGEILVEIMRPRIDMPHEQTGEYLGPFPSGAPAIFIDTVARLGVSAGIIGGVGQDGFGRLLLDRLVRDGVDCRYVIQPNEGSTAVAFVMYRQDGSRNFIYHIGNTPASQAKEPTRLKIEKSDFFHLMGCSLTIAENFRQEIIKTMEQFIAAQARISFDPNIRPELLGGKSLQNIISPILANCSVLMPGEEELLLIAEEIDVEHSVEKLFKNPKLEIIALKRGKKGSTIYSRNERFDFGVYDIKPLDPTGAGDCFDGAFLVGMMLNQNIADCTRLATAAASLNTAAFGPMEGAISMENIQKLIQS